MKKNAIYHYYVEGEDEKKLLDVLKRDLCCIESGKVDKMNVIQTKFTVARIRPLKQDTTVVLVYDTDVEELKQREIIGRSAKGNDLILPAGNGTSKSV